MTVHIFFKSPSSEHQIKSQNRIVGDRLLLHVCGKNIARIWLKYILFVWLFMAYHTFDIVSLTLVIISSANKYFIVFPNSQRISKKLSNYSKKSQLSQKTQLSQKNSQTEVWNTLSWNCCTQRRFFDVLLSKLTVESCYLAFLSR